VTHDHHEALLLADVLAVMDRGRIEQVGPPQEIYDSPRNLFVAGFLNLHVGAPPISLIDARWMPPSLGLTEAWVGVRPEDVRIDGRPGEGRVRGLVAGALHLALGSTTLFTVRVGDHDVHVQAPAGERHPVDEEVWLTLTQYHVFDKASGLRIGGSAGTACR
jgi:multiple sugar transport system ATP-binding protein